MSNDPDDHPFDFDTLAVRSGFERSNFGEHSEPVFLTSSFVHDSAEHAAAKFANQAPGFIYSRFGNPTVKVFQDRLAALEGAQACLATATGMSAIQSTLISLTKAGDHVVSARGVFGTTMQLFAMWEKYGVKTTYVDATDLSAWRAAITPQTTMLYLETPSNPLTEIVDIEGLAAIVKGTNAKLVVDNCFATPALQRPLMMGADIVVHSATKHIDGQGRVMGGAVLGSSDYIDKVLQPVVRYCGPALAPFNAWVLLKGLEMLPIRMERHSVNAMAVAKWLEQQPMVQRVLYPWLESHPQYALAKKQQSGGGAIVSFALKGATQAEQRQSAFAVINACKMLSITANLGDVKTTITHPATTTHGRMAQADREAVGLTEGFIRLAIGLESPADICADLARGMKKTR
jgi:O-succinylhomoserine sulfhydrylase